MIASPNINRVWADLIVEELVRKGIDFFCIAPGSRSTPLTTAVAAHPKARHLVHFDERGTAFCALGYGRATRRPAVWITTSGTALANGYPAVVEAATDGVPMLLLTADRPPELRQTGANQTIDQVKLFGDYTRWFFDLPTPTVDIDPAMVLTTIDHAVYRAQRTPGGPVHLNCMFREPLDPTPDGHDYEPYLAGLASWQKQAGPFTHYAATTPQRNDHDIETVRHHLDGVKQGIVVAGKLETRLQGEAVVRLANRLGWPLFPDIGSQVRLGGGEASNTRIGPYDLLLSNFTFRAEQVPDAVLHIGGRSTSKWLAQWLKQHRPEPYLVVNENPARLDPNHHVTHRIEGDVATFCGRLMDRTTSVPAVTPWLDTWREAAAEVRQTLSIFFEVEEALSEPLVAHLVVCHSPEGRGLVLASSMPVRDVDMFAPTDGPALPVAANRGASGIDGLVATAVGFSEGLEQPVTLLTGDLALLHDLNSLALLRDRPVVVIVLNNDGGGIFHFLPIAQHEDVFEPFFGTPHGLTFEAAADLFGLVYHHPTTPDDFVKVYQSACAQATGTLIEVTTERAGNYDLHRRVMAMM
ncbi:MAG TPA: 2-succinyl-5-enolpyruvyl-6-hydroxy-3-cyclohexene-1-carboxylic-acid synthase [Rhodothermales bacterium]|nr:2-succinyl-5-enolpyruvyl-6-hydroxy-3-cyclohexene-1-carboxylic-acid synthase [Rhodothermales bacterium]